MNLNQNNAKSKVYSAAWAIMAEGEYLTVQKVEKRAGCSGKTAEKWMKLFREENAQALEELRNNVDTVEPLSDEELRQATFFTSAYKRYLSNRLIDTRLAEKEITIENLEKELEEAQAMNNNLLGRVDALEKFLMEYVKQNEQGKTSNKSSEWIDPLTRLREIQAKNEVQVTN
jgi:tRNA(Glu) U13 pseudouridine synthase TruD